MCLVGIGYREPLLGHLCDDYQFAHLNKFLQDIVNYICDDDDIKAISFIGSDMVS